MFCQNCNSLLQDDANFCNKCGIKRPSQKKFMMYGILGSILLVIGIIKYLELCTAKEKEDYILSKAGKLLGVDAAYADKVDIMLIIAVIASGIGFICMMSGVVMQILRNRIEEKAERYRMYQGFVLNNQMLQCDSCNCFNLKESKFCAKCGLGIKEVKMKKCKGCGNIINDDSIFCGKCGSNEIETEDED